MKRSEGEQKEGCREWTSSKGNQSKWFSDGNWYKADGLGYEALSEVLVSRHIIWKIVFGGLRQSHFPGSLTNSWMPVRSCIPALSFGHILQSGMWRRCYRSLREFMRKRFWSGFMRLCAYRFGNTHICGKGYLPRVVSLKFE